MFNHNIKKKKKEKKNCMCEFIFKNVLNEKTCFLF